MTTVDEKEILEIEQIKANVRKMIKETEHMTRIELMMIASLFTALGALIAKVV